MGDGLMSGLPSSLPSSLPSQRPALPGLKPLPSVPIQGGGYPALAGIVANGDSLTASSGASSKATTYPSVAGNLFSPARSIVNLGVPGYTSTQIAARQGGQPIILSVSGAQLPAFSETLLYDWDFTNSNLNSWVATGTGAVVTAQSDGMLISGINNATGARRLSTPLPAGNYKVVITGKSINTASTLVMQSRNSSNASVGGIGGSPTLADFARYGNGTTSAAGTAVGIFGSANENGTGSIVIQRIQIFSVDVISSVAVTAKNINILTNLTSFTGYSQGKIGSTAVFINTDGSGNWTIYRMTAGSTLSVPDNSVYIPDEAPFYRSYVQWWMPGRNNAGATAIIDADIAAMMAYIPHTEFLIGGILTSTADSAGSIANIFSDNATRKARFGSKFIDVSAILRANGNGSTQDNSDIAAGYTPSSLRSDALHLNDAGYAIVAQSFYNAHVANGYRLAA